ncbi:MULTISPECIES: lasso peptide [Nostocales]|uniref:lasso peptide n=1 Tax=Nostocales TaxID=1161 RepID=UPI001682B5C4|nr:MULTISPECIES: lasso peptide [Nostocales]MBD2298751.1 lasso peptide [Nostoc sp. FACHB-190]MBD2487185.1 lasso peptide [Aulosira sp. FACHB-615]
MKKTYEAPQLTNYGSVQNITNAFGRRGAQDNFIIGNETFPAVGFEGSRDGVVTPAPRP